VRGMARDITEQRRAEKAMLDLRRELELTMNSMEEGVHRVNLQGDIVFENQAAARMLGWEVSKLLGKSGHATMHHTRQDGTPYPIEECPIYATFRDGVSRHVADEVFWRQDGTSFPVEYQTAAMRNDRNEIVATVVTFRDITARKRAEEALRESEERYRELFENAKDAIYVHDLSGRYTSVNRAAERLSGFTRAEILGKHFSNFVLPRDLKHVRTNLCRKLDEENETIYEVDMVRRDGQRVPVEVSSRLIFENGVAVGVQGVARDITDRKRAQDALRTYSQRLIQAQEVERAKIARELHDEIGQVLTAVRINLQSIQRSYGTNERVPRLDESIAIVDEALGRVRELSIELRPALLDDLGLSVALRWYVDRYAQRTGITAEVLNGFEDDTRLPRELETACFRIAQEALTNVARHAQAVSVSVQLERSREKLWLTIMDDGIGFDINDLRRSASADSALGLRGMEERALAVGGYLEVDSGSGRGTRIRAMFPFRRR
jgi:PAS domain S-box-containing protein